MDAKRLSRSLGLPDRVTSRAHTASLRSTASSRQQPSSNRRKEALLEPSSLDPAVAIPPFQRPNRGVLLDNHPPRSKRKTAVVTQPHPTPSAVTAAAWRLAVPPPSKPRPRVSAQSPAETETTPETQPVPTRTRSALPAAAIVRSQGERQDYHTRWGGVLPERLPSEPVLRKYPTDRAAARAYMRKQREARKVG